MKKKVKGELLPMLKTFSSGNNSIGIKTVETTQTRIITLGVNTKSNKVNSRRRVVYPSDCASVIRRVSDRNSTDLQRTVQSQVDSVQVTFLTCYFNYSATVHSRQPYPFGFCCGAGFGHTVRPVQSFECTVQLDNLG